MDTCVNFENSPIRNIISSPTIIVASFIYTSSALPELGIEDHSYGEDTNGNKKPASNAKRYPLCENRRIPFTRNPPVSCLLGRCPNPRRTQKLCSETMDKSIGYAIFQIADGRAAQRCSASFSRRSFVSNCSSSSSRIRSILALAVSSSFISSRAFRYSA